MKLTKLFSKLWLSAAALLAFSACSNEDLPTQTTSEAPKTKQIYVNLSAGQDQLRVAYGLSTNGNGAIEKLTMPEKNVKLRVAVRRGDGNPIIQDIMFTKVSKRNYATYSGPINVPTDGSGEYKIAALLMAEEGAATPFLTLSTNTADPNYDPAVDPYKVVASRRTAVTFPTGNSLDINVPYVSKWQNIVVQSGNTAAPVTFEMLPYGTVLRVRIKNESNHEKTFYGVRFTTNAFARQGEFRLNQTHDNMPQFIGTQHQSIIYAINGGVTVPAASNGNPSYSPWMYVWVAPGSNVVSPSTTGLLQISQGTLSSEVVEAFKTDQPLPTGSVPVTLTYTGNHAADFVTPEEGEWGATTATPIVMLDRFSTHALNKTGTALVTDHSVENTNVGLFNFDEANALSFPLNIDGKNYYLPTHEELNNIFPVADNAQAMDGWELNKDYYDILEPNIKIGSTVSSYKADYRREQFVSYGIRFKSQSNRYRTAFRYKVVYAADRPNDEKSRHLYVDCVHIGNENISLTEVANPGFWGNRQAKVVTRIFPAYGIVDHLYSSPLGTFNNAFGLWSSSPALDDNYAYATQAYVPTVSSMWSIRRLKTTKLAVYLITRE